MIRASVVSFGRMLAIASSFLLIAGGQGARAQTPELRSLNNQFRPETGCPVEVVSAKTDLEIDPFGTPIACRIYIDYKNTSARTLSGVKFRIGYIDADEKIRGTFHAPDGHILDPGGVSSAKWRGEKVDPRTSHVLIRVLVARYSDGTLWESEKLKDLAPGTGGTASPASGSPGGDSAAAGAGTVPSAPAGSGSTPATGTDTPAVPAPEVPPAPEPSGSDKSSSGY